MKIVKPLTPFVVLGAAFLQLLACSGKDAPSDTTHDASTQGGSAGSAGGTAGEAGSGGTAGLGGAAGFGGTAGSGGTAGTSADGGVRDSAACSPQRDASTFSDVYVSVDPDAAPPGTFLCGNYMVWVDGKYVAMTTYCLLGSEYCAGATFNGGVTAAPTCRPFPAGCSTCECMKADALLCTFAHIADTCERASTCNSPMVPRNGPTIWCNLP